MRPQLSGCLTPDVASVSIHISDTLLVFAAVASFVGDNFHSKLNFKIISQQTKKVENLAIKLHLQKMKNPETITQSNQVKQTTNHKPTLIY